MTGGRGRVESMSKAQESLSPLRDAEKWGGEAGRGKRRGGGGQKSQALKAGRACGFPSLRNLGQPDTLPPSP